MKSTEIKFSLKIALIILALVVLVVLIPYTKFRNVVAYQQSSNGDITSKDGVLYQFNSELTAKYSDGNLESEKIIGRFDGVSLTGTMLLGPKIIKLKSYDGDQTFLVRGLMRQEIYSKKE